MLPTTHIAASCLIAAGIDGAGLGTGWSWGLAVAGGFSAHLALDLVPHGFIATPDTMFRKFWPTVAEIVPALAVLGWGLLRFGSPLLCLVTVAAGLAPDVVTGLRAKCPGLVDSWAPVRAVHVLHRSVHWFEKDLPDGTVQFRFPPVPLLAIEAIFLAGVICFMAVLPFV